MGASMAMGTSLDEFNGIGVACKHHIASTVGDSVLWLRGNIIEELVDRFRDVLGGCGLLGADGAESNKEFVVDRVSVPKEGDDYYLDTFGAGRVDWRSRIGRSRLQVLVP